MFAWSASLPIQDALDAKYDVESVRFVTDLAYTQSAFTADDYNVENAFRQQPVIDVNFNADPGVDYRITNLDLLDYSISNFRALLDSRIERGALNGIGGAEDG